MRHGDPLKGGVNRVHGPLDVRFWAKVDKNGPIPAHRRALGRCWVWKAARFDSGYGVITEAHKARRAHRVSYELSIGPIPKGMWVMHRCDNPPCVRPGHLKLGTNDENMADMVRKKRIQSGADHHRTTAKLTTEKVREIRTRYRYRSPDANVYALAGEYGVSPALVSNIINRKVWLHVT